MSNITQVANQLRLKSWAEEIRACQNRPAGQSVAEWCSLNNISLKNYYYHHKRVRQACLDSLEESQGTFVELAIPESEEKALSLNQVPETADYLSSLSPVASLRVGAMTVEIAGNASATFMRNLIGALADVK